MAAPADESPLLTAMEYTAGRAMMSITAKIDARRACRDKKPRRPG